MRVRDSIIVISRLTVGATLVLAAVGKSVDPTHALLGVRLALDQLGVTEDAAGLLIVRILVTLELFSGAAIIALPSRTAGLWCAIGLVGVLTSGLILVGIEVGMDTPCGCFGPIDTSTVELALIRNCVLAGTTIAVLACTGREKRRMEPLVR